MSAGRGRGPVRGWACALLLALCAGATAAAAASDGGAPAPSIFGRDTALEPDGGADGPAQVRGSLDKEIIRRIIRRHINEVKWCYEQGLKDRPYLAGQIMVRFTIGASGAVIGSELESSTMDEPEVNKCTVLAVRRWEFPKPLGGGVVRVSYPFLLTPVPIHVLAGRSGAGAVDIAALDSRFFVHRSTDAHGVPANGLVAITDGGLLLVDTAWTDEQTEAVLRWGEGTLKRPWIGAVITHDHADRDGGLGALFRRGIRVGALDLTVAKLARRGVRQVTTLLSARAGTFTDPRGFEVFYPGPGHTADNIVVAFPDRRLVFGGCLVKAADAKDLGFTGDADLASWPGAVGRVAQRYPHHTIVPGHGDVDRSGLAFAHTLELLTAAAAAVARAPTSR